jgi:microcystin-dependent protein
MVAAGLTGGAAGLGVSDAKAGVEPFLGEIMMVGYSFCPRNWVNADGQLLPISAYSALYSLYGTAFGGDGRTNFAVPDLRGRFAMHAGHGPGLPDRRLGQRGGRDAVTLTQQNLAAHTHVATANVTTQVKAQGLATPATSPSPANNVVALTTTGSTYGSPDAGVLTAMAPEAVTAEVSVQVENATTGNSAAFDVTNPYLVMRYCVAVQGTFPSRP